MSADLYVYKVTVDSGGAPCVWRNLLSLAICKPKIRKSACKGSLIFGFGGKRLRERLIYIAEVTEKPKAGEYYRSAKFRNRPDCIYEEVSGKARRKDTAVYHVFTDERKKDVGNKFQNAYVLLSGNFRYLGKKGTNDYKIDFLKIKKLVEHLTQGHRVNYSEGVRSELLRLKRHVWTKHRKMAIGTPTDEDRNGRCNEETPSVQCKKKAQPS
jgi:Nucleotide modification associated domain 2